MAGHAQCTLPVTLRPWLKKFSYDIPPLQIDGSIVFSVNYINMVNELYSGTVRVFPLLIKGKSFSDFHLAIICCCSAKF